MELLMILVCAAMVCSCLLGNVVLLVLIWRMTEKKEPQQEATETPEEKEARRVAAEAQRKYDQAFIERMNYGGMPRKKERDLL